MDHSAWPVAGRRSAAAAVLGLVTIIAAACGSSAPSTPTPSTAPSVAAPSVAPSVAAPSAAPSTPAASAPAASGGTAAGDPATGLTIAAPYALTALPTALQQTMETQMAGTLNAFGGSIKVGFRQVSGGTGFTMLMVMAFPSGSLNDAAYAGALGGMGASMGGAAFTKSTVGGVEVSSSKVSTGGISVFHIGDHMLMVISDSQATTLPVATALINANQ